MKTTKPTHFFLLVILSLGASFASFAQATAPTIFNLFYTSGMRQVELEINLDSVMANRRNEERVGGIFRFTGDDGQAYQWTVEVNVRGRFRRSRCAFPPLMINFAKDELRAANLDTHNNLKLITHCLDTRQGEEILLREYLIYQLYQILNKNSYRTQLLQITYRNTANGKTHTTLGVIMEDEKELADRLDGELCEDCYALPGSAFDQDQIALLGLFQYMIGNIDWSVRVLRNVKLLKPHDGSPYVLIPYDFDFTAVVNPPYLLLAPSLRLTSIRQRLYLGLPQTAGQLQQAYTRLLQPRKEDLIQRIDACTHLNASVRREIRRYVEDFFREMDRSGPGYEAIMRDLLRQK